MDGGGGGLPALPPRKKKGQQQQPQQQQQQQQQQQEEDEEHHAPGGELTRPKGPGAGVGDAITDSAASAAAAEGARHSALVNAAGYGEEATLRDLLREAGTHEAQTALVRRVDAEGQTALHFAAKNGHVSVIHVLIDAGACVDAATFQHGMQPLHWACSSGRVDAAHALLGCGASVNARDSRAATPLTIAAQSGHAACAAYLLKHGADPAATDCENDTALSWTAYNGLTELLSMLAADKARVDCEWKDDFGMAPLHLAAQRGHRETVEVLIEEGVDPAPLDGKGRTPAELAAENGHQKIAAFLRRAARGGSGQGPFQSALECRWGEAFGGKGRSVDEGRRALGIYAGNVLIGNAYWATCLLPRTYDLLSVHMVILAIQAYMALCWWKTAHLDPGKLGDGGPRREYERAIEEVARSGTLPAALCHSCRVRRPPRSKHCRELRSCVLRFDHYCPFVQNAVGLKNQVWFFGVISSTATLCTFMFVLGCMSIHRKGATLALALGLLDFGLCAFALNGFTVFHAVLITRNVTTNEYVNHHRLSYMTKANGRMSSKFSKGVFQNWLTWFSCEDDSAYEGAVPSHALTKRAAHLQGSAEPAAKGGGAPTVMPLAGTNFAKMSDLKSGLLENLTQMAAQASASGGGAAAGADAEHMQELLRLATE